MVPLDAPRRGDWAQFLRYTAVWEIICLAPAFMEEAMSLDGGGFCADASNRALKAV